MILNSNTGTNASRIRHLAPDALDEVSRNPSANNAFIGACLDTDKLLAKLTEARRLNFGVVGDKRNWGEASVVSDANRMLVQALQLLTGTAP